MAPHLRRSTLRYLLLLLMANMVFYKAGGHQPQQQAMFKTDADIDFQTDDQDELIPTYLGKSDSKSKTKTEGTEKAKNEKATTAKPATKPTKKPEVVTKATKKPEVVTKAKTTGKPTPATTKPTAKSKPTAKPTTATVKPTVKVTEKATAKTNPKTTAKPTQKATVKPTKNLLVKATPPTTKPPAKESKTQGGTTAVPNRCKIRWPWSGRILLMTECEIEFCDPAGNVEKFILKPNTKTCAVLKHPEIEKACPVRNKLYFHNHVIKRNPCVIILCSSGIPRELVKEKCKTKKPFIFL